MAALSCQAGSGEVAFTFWSPRVFGGVYSGAAATGAVERSTVSEAGGFDPSLLPEPESSPGKASTA